eukprot:367430-Rhodomonas_salina.8
MQRSQDLLAEHAVDDPDRDPEAQGQHSLRRRGGSGREEGRGRGSAGKGAKGKEGGRWGGREGGREGEREGESERARTRKEGGRKEREE